MNRLLEHTKIMVKACLGVSVIFCSLGAQADPVVFQDNFNDGDAAGWSFYGPNPGNWAVSGGILHHGGGYNGAASYALIDAATTLPHFTLEADVSVISNQFGYPDWGHVGLIWGVDTATNNFNTSYLRTHWDHVTSWSTSYVSFGASERMLNTPGAANGNTYHLAVDVDYSAQTMTVTMGGFNTTFSGTDFNVLNQNTGSGIGLISWSDNVTYDNVVLTSRSAPPQPVPEPETYTMLLVGLGLLGFAARRGKPG